MGGGVLALVSGVVGKAALVTSTCLVCFFDGGQMSLVSTAFLFRV